MPGPHLIGFAADGIGPKVWTHADRSFEVSVVDAQVKIVGGPNRKNDPARIAQVMTFELQRQIDVRITRGNPDELIPLDSLPDAHPHRLVDPGMVDYFWGDADGVAVGVSGEPEMFIVNREQTWFVDPVLPHLFWDGPDIVHRPAVVTVAHDGTKYVVSWRSLSN